MNIACIIIFCILNLILIRGFLIAIKTNKLKKAMEDFKNSSDVEHENTLLRLLDSNDKVYWFDTMFYNARIKLLVEFQDHCTDFEEVLYMTRLYEYTLKTRCCFIRNYL